VVALLAAAVDLSGREGELFRTVFVGHGNPVAPDVPHRLAAVDPGARMDGAMTPGGGYAVAMTT
jgi:hypothetical protein